MRRRSRIDAMTKRWAGPRPSGPGALLADRERFASARALISAFYAVLLFLALSHLFSWRDILDTTSLTPRWPVFWLRHVELRSGIGAILTGHLASALLGVALPGSRLVRVLVAVSWLEFLALRFSFGGINHGEHLGLLLAIVLIFLPAGWSSSATPTRYVRAATLLVFSGCQAMIMLTYTMSGMWKAGGVVEQLIRGETTYLSPSGLAQQVAAKLLSDDATSVLGPWLIANYWVGPPLMLGAIYLELLALWAVARPSLHRAWGLGLIVMHVSTHLTMGVGFPQNPLWLALFFVASPFRPRRASGASWRDAWRDLPLLGGGLARLADALARRRLVD